MLAASVHWFSKKWTWLFQKPAVIVDPEHSSMAVPPGTGTVFLCPTAEIRPFSMTTTPSGIGGSVGLG